MIPLFKVHVPPEADAAVLEVLHSGYIGQGPKVDEFEARLAELLQARVATVNSGTAALTLALRLVGVGPGDIVVTTPMTCTATNLPILGAGGIPVWADVDPASGLIAPASVKRILAEKHGPPRWGRPVKAVVCVDWGGMPCDLGELLSLCAEEGVPLIEDAAHALGAEYRYRPVGHWADYTAFSFQAIKHVTTVDGGALAVRTEFLHRRAKLLRWYGIDREAVTPGDSRIDVDIAEWGYKAHLNDVAAALGLAQIPHLPGILRAHRRNAGFYRAHLPAEFEPVPSRGDRVSSWWLYTVRLPDRVARDEFRPFMAARGVQVSRVHRRNDDYSVFRATAPTEPGELPGVDEFSARMTCLPVHWALTEDDLYRVAQACREFAEAGRS